MSKRKNMPARQPRADGVATTVLRLRLSPAEKECAVATAKRRGFGDVSKYVRLLLKLDAGRSFVQASGLFIDSEDLAELRKVPPPVPRVVSMP